MKPGRRTSSAADPQIHQSPRLIAEAGKQTVATSSSRYRAGKQTTATSSTRHRAGPSSTSSPCHQAGPSSFFPSPHQAGAASSARRRGNDGSDGEDDTSDGGSDDVSDCSDGEAKERERAISMLASVRRETIVCGPKGLRYAGGFHTHCWYGNDVTLTKDFQEKLACIVALKEKRSIIPLYVYMINYTNTKGEQMQKVLAQISRRTYRRFRGHEW
ncbi:uncharacterized protein LOC127769778 isoform X1 [Oryza glaberrima]|uniref:uncharacterized protein LOC127769778 isoform X1 n=1 Tax=Oryza glaberrima TaxID=4538 RepID=UPI00224C0929|nr:uncharacterized protein LOC127769778 isoform X1 [Oryza glaberrima]